MKALVVDDEAIIRQGIKELLTHYDKTIMEIMEAKNGKDAFALVKKEKPGLIITDIRMPVMDGLKLAEKVQKFYSEIVVVILTGYADFAYAQRALRYGVADYLLKPVTQEDLDEVILKILQKSPVKWRADIDLLRTMKETINELVKSVLAEDKTEMIRLLREWQDFCVQNHLSLLEIKQLMGHFYVAYKSEFLVHQQEFIEEQMLDQSSGSVVELFDGWETFLLAQIRGISEKRTPRKKRVVDEVLQYIHDNYGDAQLNIHYLAERVGVSSSYLSKMFREVMHKPLTQYISEYRLNMVRGRLEWDEETDINRIAEECGFNDYPYFSRIFKRKFGISPLEYRNKYMSKS